MQSILIVRSCLHDKPLLATEDGTTDILGALISHLSPNIDIVNLKLPSQTKRLIFPFTINLRRVTIDTPLTISILQTSLLPQKEQEEAVINLMRRFNYEVSFV